MGEIDSVMFLKSDKRSQDLLYKYFAPKMYGICLRFSGNAMEADDILQEGFIKVFTKLKDFRNEGSLEGWIRRTIINTAINSYRKNLKYSKFNDIEGVEIPELNEENVYDKLSKEELVDLIRELPNGYRTVFNLNVIEGYTHREIGEMLKISDNTSKSQLTRARNILKKKIALRMKEKIKVPFSNFRIVKNDIQQEEREIAQEYSKAI